MRLLLAVVAASALALATPAAASAPAPGSQLYPVADRYEPGDRATLVGYTSRGRLEDGPFYAFLATGTGEDGTLGLGPLRVTETGREGWRALRASVSFTVPGNLDPGRYTVSYCNDPCTAGLGDLSDGVLAIGVDPDVPVARLWPLDEPEIANVADDALIAGPGYQASASVIRAGDLRGPEPLPPPVRPPPATDIVTAPAPASGAPPGARPGAPPGAATSPGWLLFGTVFAGACAGSVLMAMRDSPPRGRMVPT